MKAKYAGTCPICNGWYDVGADITKMKKPVMIHRWDDWGKMKGITQEKPVYWAHSICYEKMKEEQHEWI